MFAEVNSWGSLFRPEVIWVLVPVAAIVGSFWYKTVKERSRSSLKQSMVERGMSPDEIERVLKA